MKNLQFAPPPLSPIPPPLTPPHKGERNWADSPYRALTPRGVSAQETNLCGVNTTRLKRYK